MMTKPTCKTIGETKGFTIIELLVSILVLGILAGIVVVSYSGWQKSVVKTQLQHDLSSASSAMETARTFGNSYPSDVNSLTNLATSDGVVLSGGSYDGGVTYCVQATSTKDASSVYRIKSSEGQGIVKEGACFNQGIVTTLAGSGTQGFADATGSSAQFKNPWGVAVDTSGNVYVADYSNNRVRKISSSGVVTTLAGSGDYDFADGTGSAAKFRYPMSVAVDSTGTVYVADSRNHMIREISSSGVVTTLAGSGTSGFADGTGSAAQFNGPDGVAVDNTGTVYVADRNNNRIRQISPSGVVTTLAGSTSGFADGTGSAAKFNSPEDVAVDSTGNVYVTDSNNGRIRKVSPSGVVTTLAGSGGWGSANGTGSAAQFSYLQGITIDSAGNVYVADVDNALIRKVTSSGVVTTLAGSGTFGFADGIGSTAKFANPSGVAVDSDGNVYVADRNNQRIRKIE